MSDSYFHENEFLQQITDVIQQNLSNEQFGVSELAHEIGMSRSNLLRKVKKLSQISVSQFIRQIRLKQAMEMLKKDSMTVSEVAYQVGFNSTSYFIKCFREYFGYPPGEAEKNAFDESMIDPKSQFHQLAAIMFTDIEGYTKLMQKDEDKALEFRTRHRDVFNAVTKKYNGKILQYYGDGTLSIFHSAIEAVKCGVELQQTFRMVPQIPVRIGIHSGDIIFSKEDIIGDGVNIAARIESLASAGSVFISEKIYDEVKNQSNILTTSLGHFELKNVEKPMEIFAVSNPGLVVPKKEQLSGKSMKTKRKYGNIIWITWILIALLILTGLYLIYKTENLNIPSQFPASDNQTLPEKSIAVLPFINDSNDSSNVYIINGLMESILNHLQKIQDLRVISRTSVEKYRNTHKLIPELAKELGVNYFVEGSGQKIGDKILLNIQLIEAGSDRHLWSEQYNRGTDDIFNLQKEVAKKIAAEIQAIITPEEEERFEKIPTENLAAYDLYLKGRESFYKKNGEGLSQAIEYYSKALELDPEFAHAYAGMAIVYYFLDFYQTEKKYAEQINFNADKALLYDAQLPQSLLAKALYYLYKGDHTSALPHLEKALEYNPNSALIINILSDFYTRYIPDTQKYLEYALKGIKLDLASNDSTTTSFTYLHVANAFVQSGFVDEAEFYINKSVAYDPENLYSAYVKAFIVYAKNKNLHELKDILIDVLNRDSSRLDVLQEVAKIHYFLKDYPGAYEYYTKFERIKDALNMDIYQSEKLKIAMVMRKMGRNNEAEKYKQEYETYALQDPSIYKNLNLAILSAFSGNTQKAIEHIRLFSTEKYFQYWILLFLELDPLMDEVKNQAEFKKLMKTMKKNFWNHHKELKNSLSEKKLI